MGWLFEIWVTFANVIDKSLDWSCGCCCHQYNQLKKKQWCHHQQWGVHVFCMHLPPTTTITSHREATQRSATGHGNEGGKMALHHRGISCGVYCGRTGIPHTSCNYISYKVRIRMENQPWTCWGWNKNISPHTLNNQTKCATPNGLNSKNTQKCRNVLLLLAGNHREFLIWVLDMPTWCHNEHVKKATLQFSASFDNCVSE